MGPQGLRLSISKDHSVGQELGVDKSGHEAVEDKVEEQRRRSVSL